MSGAVVGFDIGNSTSYVAVAKGGGIETIDNEYSDRCTPSYVSFGEKNRFMGASAKQQAITNIKNTVFNFPRLIGKNFSDPCVQNELQFLPFKVVQLENDKIGIQCQYMKETATFTPEQIMASQLTKLKEITENHLKAPCIDVVINVPSYYTDSERRAMLDASQVAGLNCVRLVNDTTACGIAYGLYNKDFPEADKPPKHVAFVMMGQSNLQVSICAYNNGKLKVLATRSDSHLGGRNLDRAIYNHLCEDLKKRYKLDVPSNHKATVRLLQECEKLKKLMSANSTKLPLNIECFMDDKDISCYMQRDDFENLISGELARVESTMAECIKLSRLSPKEISVVELVGGSTRVPAIKALVQKVFEQEPRTTLNSDEAVARGCAIQAAICSPNFKVRDFSVTDLIPYTVKLIAHGGAEPFRIDIFPHLHHIPSSRQLDLKRGQNFEVEAIYADATQIPNQNILLGKFCVKNVKQVEGSDAKIQLKLRMNRHGIFNLSHAQLAEPYQKEVEVDMTPEEMAAAGIEPPCAPMEVDAKSAEAKPENAETDKADKAPEAPAEPQVPQIPKKKVVKTLIRWLDLPIDTIFLPQLSASEQNLLKEQECEMIQQDRLERERSNAKNALEEYIYEMRDKLSGSLEPYVLENDREQFCAQLTKLEDWLYDEGEDLPKQPYVEKLQALKSVGDAYLMRYSEAELRPAALNRLAKAIVHVEKAIQSYASGEEALKHLTHEEMEQVQQVLQEKRAWYEQTCNAQNNLPLYENPSVYVAEIDQQTQALVNATNPILTKKKPEVKPPPTEKTPANGHHNSNPEKNEPGVDPTGENNNPTTNPEDLKAKNAEVGNPETDCMDLD